MLPTHCLKKKRLRKTSLALHVQCTKATVLVRLHCKKRAHSSHVAKHAGSTPTSRKQAPRSGLRKIQTLNKRPHNVLPEDRAIPTVRGRTSNAQRSKNSPHKTINIKVKETGQAGTRHTNAENSAALSQSEGEKKSSRELDACTRVRSHRETSPP